jgi:hypothetical protein
VLLAALVGWVVLGQSLGWAKWLAIATIVTANTVSVLTADRSPAGVRRRLTLARDPVADAGEDGRDDAGLT